MFRVIVIGFEELPVSSAGVGPRRCGGQLGLLQWRNIVDLY